MVYINESQTLARTYARASLFIKTAGKCLYLFTTGVRQRENRILIGKLWEQLEHRAPPLEISALVPAQVCVHLYEQAYDPSTTHLVELFVMAELLQAQQPAACFEIGTFVGRTRIFVKRVKSLTCFSGCGAVLLMLHSFVAPAGSMNWQWARSIGPYGLCHM